MKIAKLVTVFALFAILFAIDATTSQSAKAPLGFIVHSAPKAIANIQFQDGNGQKIQLADYRGKTILLNIWATWCGPCRKEMPTLDRLQETLGGKRFEVVALSVDRAGTRVVRKFYDEIGIKHLRIVIDPTMRIMRELRVIGLPMTYLISPSGKEIGRLIGPAEWDAAEMVVFLKSQIDQSKQ